MHYVGLMGNPRRYSDFSNVLYLVKAMPLHQFMTYAAFFTATVQLIFLFNLFWSMWKGPKAPANPWNATTLEWTVPSPPPFDNFGGVHPVVYRGAYEYSVPGAPTDFIMQTEPPAVGAGD
jgi:cytochrome c oxidase subunit 1